MNENFWLHFRRLTKANRTITFQFQVKNREVTILDIKRTLFRSFLKKYQPLITDFKATSIEASSQKFEINIFEHQYENMNLFQFLDKLSLPKKLTKPLIIDYSVVQSVFKVFFFDLQGGHTKLLPLSFEVAVSQIKEIFKKDSFVIANIRPASLNFRFYIEYQNQIQDLEKLQQGSFDFDIKAFFSDPQVHAFAFLYPNIIHISYHRDLATVECKESKETVQSVITRALQFLKKADLSPNDFSLFYNDQEIAQKCIHDFLKTLTQNARLRLLQKADLNFFFIFIKFNRTKISFRFPRSLDNVTFQELAQQYFNIKDPQMTLVHRYNKEETIPLTTKISDKTILPGEEFYLRTTEPITHITRQFQIDSDVKSIDIPINSRVEDLHQLIQQAFNTGSSIESISISNEPLKNGQLISQLYIPPEEKFIVKLKANPKTQYTINKHDHLKIEPVDVELDVDSQVSTIKQLANLPKTTILIFHRKIQLNDNDKIKDAVKSHPKEKVIDAYISNLYYFEYEETKRPLELTGPISNNLEAIKTRFLNHELPQDKEIFLTDEKGISFIPSDKNIDEYPNGTTFKVKLAMKLKLQITFDGNQYPIEIENTKSCQDLIQQLSTITSHKEETLRIYSPLQKVIEPDHFLFEYFTDPNKTYKITAIPLKEFPFITEAGKLFYVYLSPNDKISYVKELIKKPKKKSVIKISPDEELYLVYNGQLLDDTKPISSILEQNSNSLEEEDAAPLEVDEPINVYVNEIKLIKVTLDFVDLQNEAKLEPAITVVKGTPIETIRNLISKTSELPFDNIVLVSNGEELPPEFELEEDITLNITIRQTDEKTSITDTLTKVTTHIANRAPLSKLSDDDGYEYEDENNDIDEDKLLEQAHGVITRSDNDDEYVYKFKYINGEEFELQLPKDVSVIQAIEAIVNMRNNEGNVTDPADVTISMGSTRLNNYNFFTSLTIPQTVNYFSVKVVSISQSLIFTRKS